MKELLWVFCSVWLSGHKDGLAMQPPLGPHVCHLPCAQWCRAEPALLWTMQVLMLDNAGNSGSVPGGLAREGSICYFASHPRELTSTPVVTSHSHLDTQHPSLSGVFLVELFCIHYFFWFPILTAVLRGGQGSGQWFILFRWEGAAQGGSFCSPRSQSIRREHTKSPLLLAFQNSARLWILGEWQPLNKVATIV